MNLQTDLETELIRIHQYIKNPINNEANTCFWVIYPLLQKCGYGHQDINVQTHNGSRGFPDFALLPGTTEMWFLEAKAWNVPLADAHIVQAINYAHTKGQRWVVLSNGQEWRLYDDFIVGVAPADRLVAVATLGCGTELRDLLEALSKTSVLSGNLEKYALHSRLRRILNQHLLAPDSKIIQAITPILQNRPLA